MILEIFGKLGLEATVRLNNRKLLLGLYRALGIGEDQLADVLREADKLEKIGPEELTKSLRNLGLSEKPIQGCLTIAGCKGGLETVEAMISRLQLESEEVQTGLTELSTVVKDLVDLPEGSICIDLGIVRGLDYYTGTIYETQLTQHPELGSVCSGGRYEDLASGFINKKLPGVGISIGVSRLVSHLLKTKALPTLRHCPTEILIILPDEETRSVCNGIAKVLREHGSRDRTLSPVASSQKADPICRSQGHSARPLPAQIHFREPNGGGQRSQNRRAG